jgi:hypothetical protein
MAEGVLDHIVEHLRSSGSRHFPQRSDLKAVRVVGHTPKPDHYTYEIVVDFAEGSERVNAKIYRGKNAGGPQELAANETRNLQFVHQVAERRKLGGVPRPIGDFAAIGAVVSTKIHGLPLQSIIMKVALLPDGGNHHLLELASRQAGLWLQQFHKATANMAVPLDGDALLAEIGGLCARAQRDGLPDESIDAIMGTTRSALASQKRPLRSSATLQDFVPLNVLVAEDGIGFCEFASLSRSGHSLLDAATFLATVEVLEKYPFCDRGITTLVQQSFIDAYAVSEQEQPLLDALKMKVLLQMFLQGRLVKESAERKKVMWANVMKRFIQQAAERSAARVA